MSLARRTHRIFNIGLLVATGAVLASLVWLVVASVSVASHLDASERDGSAQVTLLSGARIQALQARSDEAHTLLARGGSLGAAYEENYRALLARLIGEGEGGEAGLLAEAEREATDARGRAAAGEALAAAAEWRDIHVEVRRLEAEEGDYDAAVALAVGLEEPGASGVFGRLDEALAGGIGHGSDRLLDEADRAGAAFGGVGLGLALLTALALVGVVAGIQRRLSEYR